MSLHETHTDKAHADVELCIFDQVSGDESQQAVSLCRYITQEGTKLEVAKSKVPTTVTNAVSWRSEGIKYKKNEVFIDVIESINVLVRRDILLQKLAPSENQLVL